MKKRVFLIVLDSVGVGQASDADKFDDVGCDTFGTCVRSGKLEVPNLKKLGIYNLEGTSFGNNACEEQELIGSFVKLQEKSAGKDTTMGHWEIAGVVSERPMPTYPHGFPPEIIEAFETATGRKTLCNQVYSGTEVIKDYGREHVRTGDLIVYTSADSVFQIAAHEQVVPLEELYQDCKKAREILKGEHAVGRVIARPFIGEYPDYKRTVNRHDFSLQPPKETVLDAMKKEGYTVIGVGKIHDIFAGCGLTETYPNEGNTKNMELTLSLADREFEGLFFVNLVDFDMIYGHRNDIDGYVNALNEVDVQIGMLMSKMKPDDLLIVTADHGCDPGFKGTDHTREYTPCLCFGEKISKGVNLGIRKGFCDIAATISEYFSLTYTGNGKSFLKNILH